jgi:hypothetical protein
MAHGTKVTGSTARSIRPDVPFPPRTGSPWGLAARTTPSPDTVGERGALQDARDPADGRQEDHRRLPERPPLRGVVDWGCANRV